MTEDIIYSLQLIQQDFFTAFGVFTLIYLVLKIFIKNPILYKIDEESNKFISVIGLVYLAVYIAGMTIEINAINDDEKALMVKRVFGKHWFGLWLQPLLWLLITQLLRIKRVRENTIIRIVFSFLLIFSLERIVIFTTAFHRDYLPSTWNMYNELDFYPSNLILALILKISIFLLFVYAFRLVKFKLIKARAV